MDSETVDAATKTRGASRLEQDRCTEQILLVGEHQTSIGCCQTEMKGLLIKRYPVANGR